MANISFNDAKYKRTVNELGFVALIDGMPVHIKEHGIPGPEQAIIEAARVSYGGGAPRPVQADVNLLKYLYSHEHMTPFEMITLKFMIKAPIFTARQWMRHRTGSFNEISGRYSELETEFYTPRDSDIREQSKVNKQGSGEVLSDEQIKLFKGKLAIAYDTVAQLYEETLKMGIARETARIILPVATYTEFYWSVNLRNLLHFLELRKAKDAQYDIREYATAIYDILKEYCPYVVEAFDNYNTNSVTLFANEIEAMRTGDTSKLTPRELNDYNAKVKKINGEK